MNTLLAIALLASSTVMTTPAGKRLECGAPKPLQNDAVQTVRVCEPAKRK